MTEDQVTGILLKLADYGITGIKAHYDGGGDSGSVEDIHYTTKPCESIADVDAKVELWGTEAQDLHGLDSGLYTQLQDFLYHILDGIEDWWNNEGGYGNMCILIPSGEYHIDNNVRIIETENYQHEGELLQKTSN